MQSIPQLVQILRATLREEIATEFLTAFPIEGSSKASPAQVRIDTQAGRLVAAIRSKTGGFGGIEDFLHAYSLSTQARIRCSSVRGRGSATARTSASVTMTRFCRLGRAGA